MMQEPDAESKYYQRVANIISEVMHKQGYSQEELSQACQKQFGISVSQTTISKVVRGAGNRINMAAVSVICQVLRLDLNHVLSLKSEEVSDGARAPTKTVFGDAKDDFGAVTLIANPKNPAFRGYIDRTYDIFFLPTKSSSEHNMVSGTMTLSNENDAYCKVHIVLNSDKKPFKEYLGQMMISDRMRACYCIVKNDSFGEICSFVFHHRYFTQESLTSRLAVVATISAGTQRPTMHRMAICAQGLVNDEQKESFIATQLLLNNSKITISERNFNALCEDDTLCELLQALKHRNLSIEPYYVIEEGDVMKLSFDYATRAKLIAKLREHSISKRYNKIGMYADDMLWKFFTEK